MWHLKDRELEQKLNKTSHPNHTFTDRLNEVMAKIPKKDLPNVRACVVNFQRIGTGGVILESCSLEFSIEEIEHIPDYNPKKWNDFPAVLPPENKLMKFKGEDIYGHVYIGSAVFVSGCWLIPNTSRITKSAGTYQGCELCFGDLVTGQFKPWEGS